MKTFLRGALLFGALALVGIGCAIDSSTTTTTETQTYVNDLAGWQVEHPIGWSVGRNGAPDPTLVSITYFYDGEPSHSGEAVTVTTYTSKSGSYLQNAGEPGAVVGEIDGKFYVVTYDGEEFKDEFEVISQSITVIEAE